jgi:hypothetical protein
MLNFKRLLIKYSRYSKFKITSLVAKIPKIQNMLKKDLVLSFCISAIVCSIVILSLVYFPTTFKIISLTPRSDTNISGWSTHRNVKYNFRFNYPPQWKKNKANSSFSESMVRISYYDNEDSKLKTIDFDIVISENQLNEVEYNQWLEGKKESTIISDIKVDKYSKTHSINSRKFYQESYFFQKDDQYYVIRLNKVIKNNLQKTQAKETFQSLINSFNFD